MSRLMQRWPLLLSMLLVLQTGSSVVWDTSATAVAAAQTSMGNDLLKPNFTTEDIAHLDTLSLIQTADAEVDALGLNVSEPCKLRFGLAWIEEQRRHHFPLCHAATTVSTSRHRRHSRSYSRRGLKEQLEQRQRHLRYRNLHTDSTKQLLAHEQDAQGMRRGGALQDNIAAGRTIGASTIGSADMSKPSDRPLPESAAAGPATSDVSSVDCYMQPRTGLKDHHTNAQTLCIARNVVFDTCNFYHPRPAGWNASADVDQRVIRFAAPRKGAVKVGCAFNATNLGDKVLLGGRNAVWWRVAAQDGEYKAVQNACTSGSGLVVEHPVLFLVRDRFAHPWHDAQEVISTIFTSLAVANLPEIKKQGIQVVIADQMPHAGFKQTYAAISWPYKLRHLADDPYPPGTCFRTALYVHAFVSSVVHNSRPALSDCYSSVMVGFHRWIRTLHRELDPNYLARQHQSPSETEGIVRRNVVWMSRRNLESLRRAANGTTRWQRERLVPNENDVVVALQRAVMEWNAHSCLLYPWVEGPKRSPTCRDSPVMFDFVSGEFSDLLYYPDQLMTLFRSAIIMGVHGAGLALFPNLDPRTSTMIEFWGNTWYDLAPGTAPAIFRSMVHNMGNTFTRVHYDTPNLNATLAAEALWGAMDGVAERLKPTLKSQQITYHDQLAYDIVRPQTCPAGV